VIPLLHTGHILETGHNKVLCKFIFSTFYFTLHICRYIILVDAFLAFSDNAEISSEECVNKPRYEEI